MTGSSSKSQSQRKAASDDRRAQLRKAQQRSRLRKVEALNEAQSRAEALQSKLEASKTIIAELLNNTHGPTHARISTLKALLDADAIPQAENPKISTPSNPSSSSYQDQHDIHTSKSETISTSYQDSSEEVHNDVLLDNSTFNWDAEATTNEFTNPQPYFSGGEAYENALERIFEDDAVDFALPPEKTHFDGAFNVPIDTVPSSDEWSQEKTSPETGLSLHPSEGLPLVTLAHHEVTFSKRLYRRAWEMLYNMLTLPVNPKVIERAIGNTLGYIAPSRLLHVSVMMLRSDSFEPLEFFTRPYFYLPRRSMNQQSAYSPVQSSMPMKAYDPDAEDRNIARRNRIEDPYMTPLDIEKYCLESGVLASTLLEDGQEVGVSANEFQLSGKSWTLDIDRFIQALVSVGICVGRQPSFVSSDVTRLMFESMRPVHF